MVVMTSSVLSKPRRKHVFMFDSTLDMFEEKAAEELAHHYAIMLEQRAAELEITVDYYLEEFHEI